MAIVGFQWHKQFHSCLEIDGYLKKAKTWNKEIFGKVETSKCSTLNLLLLG